MGIISYFTMKSTFAVIAVLALFASSQAFDICPKLKALVKETEKIANECVKPHLKELPEELRKTGIKEAKAAVSGAVGHFCKRRRMWGLGDLAHAAESAVKRGAKMACHEATQKGCKPLLNKAFGWATDKMKEKKFPDVVVKCVVPKVEKKATDECLKLCRRR